MDQTDFLENQEIFQAPPGSDLPVSDVPVEVKPKLATKTKILIGSLGFLAITLILVLLSSIAQSSGTGNTQKELKFEIPTREQSAFKTRFRDLQNQLTEYDPTVIELAPPPVNYQIFSPQR